MKFHIFVVISLVLATILGVYAQDIAGFMSDNMDIISPFQWLTVVTVSSWILYLITPVLAYFFMRKATLSKNHFRLYLGIGVVFGVMISCWSLFVLAMSGG